MRKLEVQAAFHHHKGGRLHHLMSSIPPPKLGVLEGNAAKSISSDWQLSHWPTIVLHVFTLGHLFIQLVILRLKFVDMGLELRSIPRQSRARAVKVYSEYMVLNSLQQCCCLLASRSYLSFSSLWRVFNFVAFCRASRNRLKLKIGLVVLKLHVPARISGV